MTISDAWVDFLAGWASGGVAVLTCQPVDTVLTRLQAGEAMVVGNASSNLAVQTRVLVADFGMASLWRGSLAMISAVPMQNALLMGGYGMGKQWGSDNSVDANDTTTTLISVFIGGCTGGIIQSFLMSTVELMKVNQQVIGKSAKVAGRELLQGFWNSSSRSSNSSSSWRGLNATLLRDGIPHGVWFASYEWCKTSSILAKRLEGTSGEKVTVPLASGAFAATVAWAVGYPFDVIKTRIQASKQQPHHHHVRGGGSIIYATGVQLVKEANGRIFAGLYRGFGLKLVRAVPASMIGFTIYEFVADQLRR